MALWSELKLRIMLDVVDYVKQVKRKKLEKDLVVRETCTRFGLTGDEALVAFDELTERGILSTQEDSITVDGKEKFELTKNLFKAWQETSSPESKIVCTQTVREEFPADVKTTCTQTSAQEPPPSTPRLQHPLEPTHGDVIDKERDANRILLERNHQRETSDEGAKILAQKPRKYDKEPDNKKSNTIGSIPPIVYEDIQSKTSDGIKNLRKKKKKRSKQKAPAKNAPETMVQKESPTNNDTAQAVAQGNTTNDRQDGNANSSSPSIENKITSDINNSRISKKTQAAQAVAQGTSTNDRQNGNANSSSSSIENQITGDIKLKGNPPPKQINNNKTSKETEKVSESKDNEESVSTGKKNNKRTTIVIGDSMVKNVKGWKLKPLCNKNEYVHVYDFPGATIKDMKSYSLPSIEKKPDMLILHCGTNDLKTKKSEVEISEEIISLAKSVQSNGIDVLVSGLIARGDELEGKRQKTNFVLSDMCFESSITFVDHPNIQANKHLNRSHLHLNRLGDNILATNLLEASRI